LHAPDCTVLYPFEGNLHQFVAGPHGAAVLDVLLPPYNVHDHRDCTFYEMRNLAKTSSSSHDNDDDNDDDCIRGEKDHHRRHHHHVDMVGDDDDDIDHDMEVVDGYNPDNPSSHLEHGQLQQHHAGTLTTTTTTTTISNHRHHHVDDNDTGDDNRLSDDDVDDDDLCLIVPTGQPEDFHCISGRYRGIGSIA
jgi:PCO_ADO